MSILNVFTLLLIVVGMVYQYVQKRIIVPFVIKHRGKKFWDDIAGTHQYKRLAEYKRICEKNNIGIFWYKFQLAMMILLIILALICGLLFLPYVNYK